MSRPFNFGRVPAGWSQTKLRKVISRRSEKGRPELPLLSVNLPLGVVNRVEGDGRPAPADDLSGYQVVRRGDLVMNQLGKPHGAIGVSPSEGIISPAYFVAAISPSASPRFLHHILRTRLYISEYERRGKYMPPNQFDISWEQFRDISLVLPPLEEQQIIADYLDAETARIDALIEKKQRMVGLLAMRQVLFTRESLGVGPSRVGPTVDVDGTDSPGAGVRWVRARFLCDIDTGASDTEDSDDSGPYPFFVRSQTPQRSSRYLFDGEAVLTAGDGAGVGKVFHHFVGRFDAHQRVYVLHNFKDVSGRYFYYCFKTLFAESALDGSAKSTVDSVRRHMISEIQIPVPSLRRQLDIVDRLERADDFGARLTSRLESQVRLLQERRQALITAAVTGELEIQGAAA